MLTHDLVSWSLFQGLHRGRNNLGLNAASIIPEEKLQKETCWRFTCCKHGRKQNANSYPIRYIVVFQLFYCVIKKIQYFRKHLLIRYYSQLCDSLVSGVTCSILENFKFNKHSGRYILQENFQEFSWIYG